MAIDTIKKLSVKDAFKIFSSGEHGLSGSSVKKRIVKYGYNEISSKKTNIIIKFLSYFWGPIPFMIEIAAFLSAFIHHWADFWVISVLLLSNALVGFWQEHKAEDAINVLKKKLAIKTKVLRDGSWLNLPSRELVPGDIIRIRLGDMIPADIKLVNGSYISIDESALTGESLPVDKHISDVGYAGSIVKQGEMNGLVVGTAMNTYFGETAKLVSKTKTKSHFQEAVINIGNYLIILAIMLVSIIFLVSIYRHERILDTLQFALVLTIAAIPVALPTVLTITMVIGALDLAKKKAIVRKLSAIEEMAGIDILCLDKTGTITENRLTLDKIEPFSSFNKKDVLLYATLASRAEDQDPIDNAIITRTKKVVGVNIIKSYKIKKYKPFDPISKRTEATISKSKNVNFKVTKGAPQVILSIIHNKKNIAQDVEKRVNILAKKGYRALGVAKTDKYGKWQFLGLIPLFDPPRKDSAKTIQAAESMGLNVKMITGDHIAIAKEIAKKVQLNSDILPVESFLNKPNNEAAKIVDKADGFAQVFPEHKYNIVKLLQSIGHFVGMTGDGVNDAPALKEANVGIAVAGATDAARSAADIVLMLPGLAVIINAIKDSRKIFQRMNSYTLYRIAETIRVLFFMTLSIIVFNFYPVTAIMIVLLALLNDFPIMTVAFDNVKYSNEPQKWDMNLVLTISTVLGIVGVTSSFGIFYIGNVFLGLSHEILQSFMYLKLSVAGHLTLLVTRTRGPFWSIKPAKILFFAILITQTIATLIVVYGIILPPIGWELALFVWAYALIAFLITDIIKVFLYRFLDSRDKAKNKLLYKKNNKQSNKKKYAVQ